MCQNAQKKWQLIHIYSRLSLYHIQNRCYNIIDFDCNYEERAEERKESMNYDVNELEMIDLDNTANLNPDDIADSAKESENVSDNEAYLSETPASTNLDETQVIPTPIAPVEPDMMDILGIDKSVNIDAPHDMDAVDATVMVDAEEVNRMVAEAQAETDNSELEDNAETEETEAEEAESDSEETESDSEEAEAEESDEASEETDSETNEEIDDTEDGEEISEEEMKELGDLEYHDEEKPVNKKPGKTGGKKKGGFFGKLSWTDYVIGAVALIVLILGVAIISITAGKAATIKELGDFAVVGSKLTSIRSLGDNTIDALVDNVKAETLEKKRLEEEAAKALEEEEKEEEEEEEEDEEAVNVKVSFTSVEKDLKIKFTNEKTGKLITGVEFVVNVVDPKGKELTWKDTDKDGIIYEKDLVEGEYKVTIEDVEDYTFPATSTKVKVKGKIVYQAINVMDEIKSANEVNEAVEDTAAGAVDTGAVVSDTVAKYDDNTDLVKTNPDSDVAYTKVDISAIKAPGTAAPATRAISRGTSLSPKTLGKFYAMNMSEVITPTASVSCGGVNEGESTQASVTVSPEGTAVTAISWESSNDGVATVSGGTVNGISAGTATITATVTLEGGSTISGSCDVTVSEPQPVVVGITGVNISAGTLSVEAGKTATLTANVNNDTTLDKGITWTSNNEGVAKVAGGTVTGVAEGTAIITATSVGDASKSASCTVTVTKVVTAVTGVSVNPTSVSLEPGKSASVVAQVTPDNATNKSVSWSSSNPAAATVDGNGKITAVAVGEAIITATTADGGKTSTCKVTVTQNVALALKEATASVAVSGKYQIVPTVTGTTNTAVTYATSNDKVATVDASGVVTGVAAGEATITVTSAADTTKTATVKVSVINDPKLDKTTPLLDSKGNQVYVKENGKYREAKSADYYTFKEFYIKLAHNYRGWQTIDGKRYYYVEGQGGIGVPVTGEQIIGGTKWNFASDGSLAMNSTLGIDVSKWNGSIDWNAVRNSGVTFVIIRCGYRGSSTGALIKDQKFDSYIAGAEAAGLNIGLYVFSQAITEREAVEEASMAVSLASGHRISLPIFIDTEKASNGRANGLSAGERTQIMKAFCETVKSSGYTPGIYASKSWFENQLNMGELNQYRIWLAQYASQATYGGKYDMWQYTSRGSVSGISGNVDMNINLLGY